MATAASCPLQHWSDEPYLDWKREQVLLTLARERLETEIEATVATPPASRRRLALHARRTQDGRVVLGFKARRSWRLVELKACPVADPADRSGHSGADPGRGRLFRTSEVRADAARHLDPVTGWTLM
ncbi:MAG: hypothetical protein ACWGHP_10560 [Stenotrophomonas sp.]